MAFASGLPAYVLIKALAPGFFAREDTATPVKIAVGALILNVAVALSLMPVLAHVGIALATAISAWANAGALAILLYRRGLLAPDDRLKSRLGRTVLASVLMAAVLWLAVRGLSPWLVAGSLQGIAALILVVVVGLAVYGVLAQLLGVMRWAEMRTLLRRT